MRILIVEDSEERRKKFREHFIGHTVVFTMSVYEAKMYIDDNKWDLICLDHDLSEEDTMTTRVEGTGHEVARHMIEVLRDDEKTNLTVIIHSLNVYKAEVMEEELGKCGFKVNRVPFTEFFQRVKRGS